VIVGVSHVAMEARLPSGISLATELGFTVRFQDELTLPPDFEHTAEVHAQALPLAVLHAPDSIELEIVDHAQRSGNVGAYRGIFRCEPPPRSTEVLADPRALAALAEAGLAERPVSARFAVAGVEAWFDRAGNGRQGIVGVLAYVRNLSEAVEFWSKFARAAVDVGGEGFATLSVRSPVGGPSCRLLFVENGAPAVYSMSDDGFPSLGLLSSQVSRDCEQAVSLGAALWSEPITTSVNGRAVTLALIRAPSGMLVELLGLPTRGRTGATSAD